MSDQTIQDTITNLDKSVSKDGARVALIQYGGGPDESQIIANHQGYLRLGIEFLKAAYSSPSQLDPKSSNAVALDIDYLLTKDSNINFDLCERREPNDPQTQPPSLADRLIPAIVVIVFFGGFILSLVGLITVIKGFAG